MKRINCPLCGESCIVTVDRAAWFELTVQPVIASHRPGPRAVLDRLDVKHPISNLCLASGCTVGLAEGIAADRRAGVHLRSHP